MNLDIKLHKEDLPAEIILGDNIAVDCEFMGLNFNRDRLCLVQISTGKKPVKKKIIALAGYHEPSTVFTLGEDILLLNTDEAALLLAEAPEALIIVESRQMDQFKSAASNLNVVFHQSSQIKGFNILK